MALECIECGQWLTSTEVMAGYCWNCNRTLKDYEIDEGLS